MKQKKLIFNFFVNRNCKKLTDSRKRAKILADNRKRHHPIETLLSEKVYATKGIVGGFEFSVLQRNWEKMAREAMDVK